MNRISNIVSLIVVVASCTFLSACTELKQAGRTVGHVSRDVTREIGHASRDVAKEIGRGATRVMTEAAESEDESEGKR